MKCESYVFMFSLIALLGCNNTPSAKSLNGSASSFAELAIAEEDPLNVLEPSPDGKLVAGGFSSGSVIFWDSDSAKVVFRISGNLPPGTRLGGNGNAGVHSMKFSADSRRIIVAGQLLPAKGQIEVWDLPQKSKVLSITVPVNTSPHAAIWANNELEMIAALRTPDPNKGAKLHSFMRWSVKSGEQLPAHSAINESTSSPVSHLLQGINGNEIITAHEDGHIVRWNLMSGSGTILTNTGGAVHDMIRGTQSREVFVSNDRGMVFSLSDEGVPRFLERGLSDPSRLFIQHRENVLLGWGGDEALITTRWASATGNCLSSHHANSHGLIVQRCIVELPDHRLRGWGVDLRDLNSMKLRIWELPQLQELDVKLCNDP